MKNIFLYVVVSAGGAAVLALEMLGTRILGPFYGVDLFLWSALITVTLAALSTGYMIGGRMADNAASLSRLSMIIALAGLWVVLIPWIKHPFLSLVEPLGLRGAVLAAAFILFFPPLAFLGMISPFAIKLRAASLGEVGRTAGNLYALSTLASVFSALLTGFVLIPNVGVTHLTMIVGLVLIITALIGFILERKSKLSAGTGTVAIIVVILFWSAAAEQPHPGGGLLAVRQSPYGELRVLDTENGRHLLIDGAIHSLVDTSTWNSCFHYAAVMDLPKCFFDKPGRMLLIGLGGGSLMKQYSRDFWEVEAVEIDPAVVRLAYEYFRLLPLEGKVYQTDGRQFLTSTKNTYDVILMDAFGSSSIPFHLVTEEAFALIASHLNPGGIFALNVETVGWDDPIVKTLAVTLIQEFTEVLALPMEEPPDRFGNIVLLASNRKLVPLREPEDNATLDPEWRYGPGYQRLHAWNNRFTPDISNSRVLVDDLNPIDVRVQEINLAAREDLHKYFKPSGLSW